MRNLCDLDGPVRIFDILKKLNLIKYFYWITSHISEKDKQVSKETGIEIITKSDFSSKLIPKLQRIVADEKTVLILDDEEEWLDVLSQLTQRRTNFDTILFQDPLEVENYLKNTPVNELPIAYIID